MSTKRRRGAGSVLAALFAVVGLVLVAVALYTLLAMNTAVNREVGAATRASRTPDQFVTLWFTEPRDIDRPEERVGGLDERLATFLAEATTSVDVAIYDLDAERVTTELVTASRRGVRVRLVTDTDNLDNAAIGRLKAAGIPVVEDKRAAIMHHKFAVVDRAAVWMGSWNFTTFDTYRYNNNAALWRSPALAVAYGDEFEALFAGKFGSRQRTDAAGPVVVTDAASGTRVEAYFTPRDNPTPAIVARVKAARSRVVVLAYSFTQDDIGRAMLDRQRVGVRVQGVFEKTGTEAANSPSEYRRLKEAGADVRQDGNRYLMHHKVIVIDERTVIFGSFNFSASAEDNNENCLIVENPDLARQFLQEFDRLYARAPA